MEVSGITQNVNSTVPLTPQNEQNQLNKVQKNEAAVLHKDKDAAIVSLSQSLDARKSGLFESISQINNTFAITQIAQKGLDRQEEIVTKMQDVIDNKDSSMTTEMKKNELIELVKDFNKSIQTTTFNNEMLLTTQKSFEEITLNTPNDTFFIQTPDMQKSMENLAKLAVNYDGSEKANEDFIKEIENTLTNISTYSKTYEDVKETITSNPLQDLVANIDPAILNSNTFFVDYGKNMNDFNKTNITAQFGYLAAAQANILQEQTSKLLV